MLLEKIKKTAQLREYVISGLLSSLFVILWLRWIGFDYKLIGTAFVADDRGDTWLNSWVMYQAMENLLYRPFDLGYAAHAYGDTNAFAYTYASYGIAILMLPIYLLSGHNLILAYNIINLLSFPAAALATTKLMRFLAPKAIFASTITSLLITFNSYRFAHYSHNHLLVGLPFLILCILYLHKILGNPNRNNFLKLAFVTGWLVNIDGYLFGMFVVILFIFLFLCGEIIEKRMVNNFFDFSFDFLVSFFVFLLLFYPFSQFKLANSVFLAGHDLAQHITYSSSLQGWFASEAFIYFRLISNPIGEGRVFIGFWGIIATLIGMAKIKSISYQYKTTDNDQSQSVKLFYGYIFLILLSLVLTLGPRVWLNEQFSLPLPYAILAQFPIFSGMRVPARYIFVSIIASSVLFGILLKISLQENRVRKRLVQAFIFFTVIIECVPNNRNIYYSSNMRQQLRIQENSPEVKQPVEPELPTDLIGFLNTTPANTPIFNYPFGGSYSYGYYRHQPLHNRPMLNMIGSLQPSWVNKLHLPFWHLEQIELLRERKIRYVIIYWDLLDDKQKKDFEKGLLSWQKNSGQPFIYVGQFGFSKVYDLQNLWIPSLSWRFEFDQPIGPEWHPPEFNKEGVSATWMSNHISRLSLPISKESEIILTLCPHNSLRETNYEQLQVLLNNVVIPIVRNTDKDCNRMTYSGKVPAEVLKKSSVATLLELKLPVNAITTPKLLGQNEDVRNLGIQFDWIDVKPFLSH